MTNIPRLPLDENMKEEPVLGIHMSKVDWAHVGLWGFINMMVLMKPQKVHQVSVGFKSPKAIQVARYPMVVVFQGGNKEAQKVVWQALTLLAHNTYTIHANTHTHRHREHITQLNL